MRTRIWAAVVGGALAAAGAGCGKSDGPAHVPDEAAAAAEDAAQAKEAAAAEAAERKAKKGKKAEDD